MDLGWFNALFSFFAITLLLLLSIQYYSVSLYILCWILTDWKKTLTLIHFRSVFCREFFAVSLWTDFWLVCKIVKIIVMKLELKCNSIHNYAPGFSNATVAYIVFNVQYPHDDSIKCGFLPCWLFHYGWSGLCNPIQLLKSATKNRHTHSHKNYNVTWWNKAHWNKLLLDLLGSESKERE